MSPILSFPELHDFRRFADLFPEALLLVAADGTILAANKGVERRLGFPPSRLIGRRLAEVTAESAEYLTEYLRTCSRSREMLPGSLTLTGEGGYTIACRCEGEVFQPAAEGSPALILIRLASKESASTRFLALNQKVEQLSQEVARRRQAEQALAEQKEWLRTTLASIGDAVIATDTEGRVTFMNPTAQELTGWRQDEATGRPLGEIFRILSEETREPVENPVDRVLREGVVVGLANHTVAVARDGTETPIEDSAAPIRNAAGVITGVVLVFHDVSERRRVEREAERLTRELQRRVAEFETLLRVVPICIAVADSPDCRHIWTNPAFGQLVRLPPSGNVSFSAPPEDRPKTFRVVENGQEVPPERLPMQVAVATGQSVQNVELQLALDDGSHIDLLCSAAPLFDEVGQVRGGVFAGVDLTERKRHEALLSGQKRVLELMVQDAPLSEVLEAVCRTVEDQADRRLIATVLLLDEDGVHLRPIAGRRAPEGWSRSIDPLRIGPRVGSCGTAAYLAEQVIVEDIATNPLWADFAELALSYGLKACWSTPIMSSEGGVLGTFAVYYTTPRRPDQDDLRLVDLMSRTAGIAIERSQVEKALRESEEKFRLLADTIPQLAWMARPDGHIFWYNRRWYEYTGTTPEQMQGWGWQAVHDPEVLPAVMERWRASLISGEPFDMVFPLRGADGQFRPFLTRVNPLRDDQGRILYWFGTNTDVTEIRQMEEALRAGQERLVAALDASDTGTFRWDPVTGEFLDFDDRLKRLFGLRPEDPIRSTEDFLAHVHPEDIPRLLPAVEACRQGADFEMEYRVHLPNGKVRWLYDRARMVQADGERRVYLVGACTDITQRKQVEHESQLYRERLDLVVNSVDIGLWYCDLPFDKLIWNAKVKEHFGLPPDYEVTIDTFYERLHPDDRERTRQAIEQAICDRAKYDIEYRTIGLDGRERWVRAIGQTFCDSAGQPISFDGITVDVTERVRQEQALREADRRKTDFLATLAHELRNPLAPIRNGLQLLRLAGGDRATAERAVAMMERQLGQMVHLIDDLLDVSRITRGKLRLRRERVELAGMVRSAVETARPLIDAGAHRLDVSLPQEPTWLDGDPTRLAQVFANLLTNAAKYTDRGGRIWLSAVRQEGEVIVSVQDTGIGIAAEHLPRLFEMFSQVDPALERSQGGLGIGLSLVKGLVEMHGGTVHAQSEGPGRGSAFTVRLPVVAAARTPEPVGPRSGQGPAAPRRRILVADDNRDAAESLAMMLRFTGHEVHAVHDGREAAEAAGWFRPDVAFLDIGMPKLNGFEVARHIRQQPGGARMVLVAITGWGQEEDRRRSQEAGFDHHLTKPVDPTAVTTLLTTVILTPQEHE